MGTINNRLNIYYVVQILISKHEIPFFFTISIVMYVDFSCIVQ